jgi:heat shock protein HspQ
MDELHAHVASHQREHRRASQRRQRRAWTARREFGIGQIVRHRIYPFRGVIFDVDPTFANTEEWWLAIPEAVRPRKDQPYYHLLAENEQTTYVAYVSEQNLLPDETGKPVRHPPGGRGIRRAAGRPLRAAQPRRHLSAGWYRRRSTRGDSMTGIAAYGAYVPITRLPLSLIAGRPPRRRPGALRR